MLERMGPTPEQLGVQPPIGEAKKLEAAKETLPTVEVNNHVLWVNENFPELPYSSIYADVSLFMINKNG